MAQIKRAWIPGTPLQALHDTDNHSISIFDRFGGWVFSPRPTSDWTEFLRNLALADQEISTLCGQKVDNETRYSPTKELQEDVTKALPHYLGYVSSDQDSSPPEGQEEALQPHNNTAESIATPYPTYGKCEQCSDYHEDYHPALRAEAACETEYDHQIRFTEEYDARPNRQCLWDDCYSPETTFEYLSVGDYGERLAVPLCVLHTSMFRRFTDSLIQLLRSYVAQAPHGSEPQAQAAPQNAPRSIHLFR